MEAVKIINLLRDATDANLKDKFRDGSLVRLGDGELIVTGDIHGHKRNFERIMTFADLENNPRRHLLLQEIIHGACEGNKDKCLSYEVLFEAVQYKLKFPDRIHFVIGNHDTAFICDREIIKNGRKEARFHGTMSMRAFTGEKETMFLVSADSRAGFEARRAACADAPNAPRGTPSLTGYAATPPWA